jgi:iron complex outermembrane receptor protein
MSIPSKRNKISRALFLKEFVASTVILSSLSLLPAYAQQEQTEEASKEKKKSGVAAMMGVIQVTARKREESLKDAPISFTAFSGDGLKTRGIENISEVGGVTPNLTYQNNLSAGVSSSVATVYIRGVGQRDFLGTIDNGVGFYIDDVYIARTVALLDVDRIEVLLDNKNKLISHELKK